MAGFDGLEKFFAVTGTLSDLISVSFDIDEQLAGQEGFAFTPVAFSVQIPATSAKDASAPPARASAATPRPGTDGPRRSSRSEPQAAGWTRPKTPIPLLTIERQMSEGVAGFAIDMATTFATALLPGGSSFAAMAEGRAVIGSSTYEVGDADGSRTLVTILHLQELDGFATKLGTQGAVSVTTQTVGQCALVGLSGWVNPAGPGFTRFEVDLTFDPTQYNCWRVGQYYVHGTGKADGDLSLLAGFRIRY